MKIQLQLRHIQTGHTWLGENVESTQEEFDELDAAIKTSISALTYLELNGDIIPGDFIRQHCSLRFIKTE